MKECGPDWRVLDNFQVADPPHSTSNKREPEIKSEGMAKKCPYIMTAIPPNVQSEMELRKGLMSVLNPHKALIVMKQRLRIVFSRR